ncbi:hypothetical protein OEZ85_006228 [Tetradesmus obliquus]|uniref:Protein kinase domain-containing protein n=1 Tax=Tetradesmus obliquus TaxID=3088 RepID=A0ABY8TU77_TETOB|nr:hypothetical protein OEZ85_006228 [Tetradesmus obliquus]
MPFSISFDENALLAGSARPTVRSKSPEAYQDGRAFAASLQDSLFSGQPFAAALQQQLRQQLRVQVYNHTFTAASSGLSSSSSRTCTNVHAVLSSRRGDGKEALLLATPINHQATSTDFEQDASGALLALALGAALLRHLGSSAPWLAKEVLWLLPDASCGLVPALQAWADAYQRPVLLPPASSPAGPGLAHFGRAGVLQQGLLLELPSGAGNRLQVSLEGHEGLLPKLDLFWLIRWYCYSYVRAPVELTHMGWTFALPGSGQPAAAAATHLNSLLSLLTGSSGSAVHPALLALQQHVLKFTTACQFMWRQARGLPTGGHAPFKDLMADVATLRVLVKDPQGFVAGPVGFTGATGNAKRSVVSSSSGVRPQAVLGSDELLAQLCDAVELLLRSCSGLVERFHHSLFLYVLTDLEHYVSVERYIGPLAALVCVLALQVTAILSQLSLIPAHTGLDACSRAAEVLLASLSQSQAVHSVSLSAHCQGCCLLAGTAGLGAEVLQQQLVMRGSSWAPSACCAADSPFLYRTAHTPDDALTLPEDWAALHDLAGLRTFLAAQVAVPGQGVVGVLCLASQQPGAFAEPSWGLLLAMAATGLVPLLAGPWLGGLSGLAAGLAAGLADVASMDGFAGFGAGFLQGAGALLGAVTNRHLGVRLGLLGEGGEELLLLQPSEGRAIQSSDFLLQQHEASASAAAADDSMSLFGGCESLQPFCATRLAAAGTLLHKAAQSRQQCFVPDAAAFLEQVASPPADLVVASDDAVGSMVVVPLFGGDGAVLGGLYLVYEEAGQFLKEAVFARQAAALLQGLLRQEFAVMMPWEELLATSMSCFSNSTSLSAAACVPGRSAELGVLQKTWQMQDKQVACATRYSEELQLHSVLGEGGFSTVYNGSWHGSSTAIKVMRLSPDDKLGIPAKSAMEMAALSTLRHPNIVTCYACLTDMLQEQQPAAVDSSSTGSSSCVRQQQGPLGIRFRQASEADLSGGASDSFNILVMERCDRGNLADAVRAEGLLHRRGPDGVLRVSMGLLYTVLLDVAAALRYMHSMGLVHLDVKASNVLLQTTAGRPGGFPVAKLGDLGLVKLLGDSGSLVNRSTSGTLTHLAPERLQAGSLITPAADTYSFGVLMYELYTGRQPYSGQDQGMELMRAVFNGLRPVFPDSTPPGYRALAECCWSRHISARPCFEEVVGRLQDQYIACRQGRLA